MAVTIFVLAVDQNMVAFFSHLKHCVACRPCECFELSRKDRYKLQVQMLLRCAKEFQRSELVDFFTAWIAEMGVVVDNTAARAELSTAHAKAMSLFIEGGSIADIEQAVAAYSALDELWFAQEGAYFRSGRLGGLEFHVRDPKDETKTPRVLDYVLLRDICTLRSGSWRRIAIPWRSSARH
jgi:hypothetical protein